MDKKFKDLQFYKFCTYGFLKNLRFFEPFLILFFLEKGLSYFQIGLLYSVMKISTNILEIPTGIVADSIGRRRSMVFSFSSYIISFLIFYISKSFYLFTFSMILYAFGEAFRSGTHKAMILEYLKIKGWQNLKVYYYGNTRSCSQLGSAISSLLAAGIVFYSGNYQTVFLISVIPYVLDLILMLTYPKELDGELKEFNWKNFKQSFSCVIYEFAMSFKSFNLFRSILLTATYSGFYSAIKDFLQPVLKTFALSLPIFMYLENEKRSAIVIGIVYFIIYLLTSFFSRKSGKFSEHFKNLLNPLLITMNLGFIFGIISGFTYNSNWLFMSIIFYLGIYLIENLRRPIGVAYISENINSNILASVLSAESQLKTILAAIIVPIVGFLSDKFNVGIALMIISSSFLLINLFFISQKKR
ncbi:MULTISPECIES: MFS transporter [unclassified Marinitoga]|uniref:MFS transporter n=1 Tax=unclassified Marinitoga TaxID=2640159 RepID=UPI000640FD9C|nr:MULTISPECIES: MFS transporter [unclassified Marinitoga]KLO22922.1 MFS transporter [Marinitoga sp. 1155]NUV00361.1 MFS transporter [Marinitoga sp. 1154]